MQQKDARTSSKQDNVEVETTQREAAALQKKKWLSCTIRTAQTLNLIISQDSNTFDHNFDAGKVEQAVFDDAGEVQ